MIIELIGEQLKMAETQLKRYLPRSQQVHSYLTLMNRVRSDPAKVLVDRWPEFNVVVCKAQYGQESIFIMWRYSKQWHQKKHVPSRKLGMFHMVILEDVSKLPAIDSSGISISSLDESHLGLVNQKWKFGDSEVALRMIRNMITNFPSCCVLDSEGKPVSWVLTYASCAMGMLYTLPEHRGKGYAKALISTMAKRLHAQNYPVYCFIEEENMISYRLFKTLGFTEDPSYREAWFAFNDLNEG